MSTVLSEHSVPRWISHMTGYSALTPFGNFLKIKKIKCSTSVHPYVHFLKSTINDLWWLMMNCMVFTITGCVICQFAGKNSNEPLVMFGDIAIPEGLQNADPCTARGCLWPKASDGNVYVPYRISNQYCKSHEPIPLRGQRAFILILIIIKWLNS